MKINVHAGHNPDGKTACGAIGLIKESTEARKVKDKVISLLRAEGHTVYDCTCENGKSQNDVLSKIVKKCNEHAADLDISIHFNAGRNDYEGDNSTGGVEVWIYNETSKSKDEAERVCNKISELGLRNRGVKTSQSLYVLRKTKAPAMLIECCFVDDADDVRIYNSDKIARAIVSGILNKTVSASPASNVPATPSPEPKKEEVKKSSGFLVKVTDEALNIRSGPGTNHRIVGCIRDNGTYTIVDTAGSWGKLKSGAGWISISTRYVKYL